jgi:predicted esterase
MDRAMPARALATALPCLLFAAVAAAQARIEVPPADEVQALDAELAPLEADPPAGIPRESIVTLRYYLQLASELPTRHPEAARRFWRTAKRMAEKVRAGSDPFADERGLIVRGYRSTLSTRLQGYSIFLGAEFDATQDHPLIVLLHGGSSNHHLFLSVVLGNNVQWASYHQNLWTEYEPRWDPGNWILLAAHGFGQAMWRWAGEQDVFDAIADASRVLPVDPDRVFLNGISNGGVGTWTVGFRHAWRFAGVLPMAGAPSWKRYEGSALRPDEELLMSAWSAENLAINGVNTFLRFFHGDLDGGPMKPEFVFAMERRLKAEEVPYTFTRYADLGHDIIYTCHRRGQLLEELDAVRRNRRPERVRLASADYRAARQHWVEVAEFADYPVMAHVEAAVADGRVTVTTEQVARLRLYVEDIPVPEGGADLVVDGTTVLRLPATPPPVPLVLERGPDGWAPAHYGPSPGPRKLPGLSGPLPDAHYEPVLHVYGTGVPEETEALRGAAERAGNNWILWIWDHDQRVVADTEVTEEDLRDRTLVVFGTLGNNSLLRRMAPGLPIELSEAGIRVGERLFDGEKVGVRFIAPNPLNPSRYVVIQAGNTADAAVAGNQLPDFLPDFVVYDDRTTAERERLVARHHPPLTAGFFDTSWRLREGAGEPVGEAGRRPR